MRRIIHQVPLQTLGGTDWTARAFTSGAAQTCKPINCSASIDQRALVITLAGAAPDVDITLEYSLNGEDWFSAVDTAANDLSAVATTLVASAWIDLDNFVAAPWIRFTIDPDADATVTAVYVHAEEG